MLILLVLRFGPKFFWLQDDESEEGDNEDEEEDKSEADAKMSSFRREEYLRSAHTTHSLGTQDSAPMPERRVVFEAGFPQSLTAEDAPSLLSARSAYFEGSVGSVRHAMEGSVTSPQRRSSLKRRRSSVHLNRPTFHG